MLKVKVPGIPAGILELQGCSRRPVFPPAGSTHRPVVVHVAQLVGEALYVVGFQLAGVVHHVVVGGGHAAILHCLAHHEEIIPAGEGKPHSCATGRALGLRKMQSPMGLSCFL